MSVGGPGPLVAGIGNSLAGDDRAGLEVARLVRERASRSVRVVEIEREPSELLELWVGAPAGVVIDAAAGIGPAGTVRRIDAAAVPLPAGMRTASTHALGLGDAIELARALGRMPERLVVYAIAGERFAAGSEMSEAVASVLDEVSERVLAELSGEQR